METLTAIVPYRNGGAMLARLVASLPPDLPVVVVDDLSETAPPLEVQNLDNVRVIRLEERGYFAGAVNAGMAACESDALILNQDVYFEDRDWLKLVGKLAQGHAAVGEGVFDHKAWRAGYIQGSFMLIRRDAWEQVGPFNAADYPLWGCTCEWQARACRLGWTVEPLKEVPGMVHPRTDGRFGAAINAALQEEPQKARIFLHTPPAISVIIPSYNYAQYLTDAVNSVIGGETCLGVVPGQTFASYEVVIVDDASTDDTYKVARRLADPFKGVRYLRLRKNRGTAGALNAGIQASYGEAIAILSADDMFEPEHLELLYREIERHPHTTAYSDLMLVKGGQRFQEWRISEYDFDKLLWKNLMGANVMFPRQAWRDVGGYPEAMAYGREDWAMNVALGANGWCGRRVAKPTYLYRREKQSRSFRTGNVHRHEGPRQQQDAERAHRWAQFYQGQMRALFPALYAGDRPMGCCGDQRSTRRNPGTRSNPGTVAKALNMPGRDGMVILEYVGGNDGNETWWGAVTGTRYVFGGGRPMGYVDARDAPGFLGARQGRKRVFREVTRGEMPKPTPEMLEEAGQPEVEAGD